ncbi:flagellar hook-basal body protein [Solimonas sp. SE-A11]|uniref:flagellar hook-basal body protein n=1 Tax=Solimonas sp. SE-A11 TaxID=3054954 RepID=UPI00259D228F|nr:flagellar hook basal-body protein [Solimonas sp. SE-A11]MDM4772904.1 flagellar hook basal-body protein [Solimonas sp. SE-A11]
MTDIAALVTATLANDQERLRIIAQNLANASTPAYRAEIPVGTGAFASLIDGSQPGSAVEAHRSQRQGAIQQTGRKLDLAIEGEGWFRVQAPEGVRYTRRGDFEMDPSGRVQTAQGLPLLAGSAPLSLPNMDFEIDAQGAVRVGSGVLDRILLAQADEDTQLVYVGEGLYAAAGELPIAAPEAGTASIRQGAIERGNVDPLQEMVAMMQTVRHFGSSAQALRAYDQMLDAAINRSGDF